MGHVQQLYKLQTYDTEIQEKTKRLKAVLAAQKGNEALQKAKGEAETAVANFTTAQTKHKTLSHELETITSKAKNSERRLYSGKVTNPKELSDLQQEIEALGRRRETLEEEILEAMVLVEETQEEKDQTEAVLAELSEAWEAETVSLKTVQNELALRLHKLGALRKQHAQTIPQNLLLDYEQLRKKKGGVAVSKLRVNQCLSCQLTVSALKVKEAREGKLLHCGGCDRILYPA